jgi:hypothetical protein
MSLHRFGSETQKKIVFSPSFGGIRAVYFRRIEDKETGKTAEYKSVVLYVSPQGNFESTDGRIGTRVNVLWAKTEDLKFDSKPFIPEEGDTIKYYADGGEEQRYRVVAIEPQRGSPKVCFSYEDGHHSIIRIHTVREK